MTVLEEPKMLMRLIRMMGRQSSLLSNYYARISTWNKIILISTLIIGLTVPSGHTLNVANPNSRQVTDSVSNSPPSVDLPPSRTNSRFLRNFPPYDFLNYARRNGIGDATSKRAIINGNSPVFYIRLPPAPYILVPGLGYVSPHPYNSNSPALTMGGAQNPVMMNMNSGLGLPMSGGPKEQSQSQSISNNVISLPLKFLSNGRPAQIESPTPTKKQPPKKNQISDSKSTTSLLSGGKYSFNGRPNGVFIVRSPVFPTAPSRMSYVPSYLNMNR